MTTIFVGHTLGSIASRLRPEGGWIAVVDIKDCAVPKGGEVLLASSLERDASPETVERRAIQWLKEWSNRPQLDGKSVKGLLEHEGTSLWWFGESQIYRDRLIWRPALLDIVARLEAFLALFERVRPTEVVVADATALSGFCAAGGARSMGIAVTARMPADAPPNELVAVGVRCLRICVSTVRDVLARLNRERFGIPGSTVLFLSYFHSIYRDPRTGARMDNNFESLEGPLRDAMRFSPRTLYVDRWYYSPSLKMFAKHSVLSLESPRCPIEAYTWSLDAKAFSNSRKYLALWRRLSGSPEFRSSLVYRGVDIWPLIKDSLAFVFIKQCPEAIGAIEAMGRALDAERPRVVLIHNESGFYGRAMIVAARKRSIRTVGVGHGPVSDREIEFKHEWDGASLPCPIPDVTALYGEKDRKQLISGGLYREGNLAVTGGLQYDRLAKASELFSRERLEERFKCKGKRLVAVTTQPFKIYEDRENWLKAVLGALKDFDNVFVVVKPHPGEGMEMHEAIRREVSANNAVVTKDLDTKELLFSCDLAITSWSMTGLEALIFGKPMMTVNFTGRPDMMGYEEYGASIAVRAPSELPEAIRKALAGDLPPGFKENAARYIADRAYRIDGKAAERTLAIIERLIKE
jgi:glycosyltransferase involved in cell wall biosynthesis